MRKTRFFTGFLVGSLLLIALCTGAAQAQVDLTIWDGSLWKVKQIIKGFYWDETSPQTLPGRGIGGSDWAYGVLTLGAFPSFSISIDIFPVKSGLPVFCHDHTTELRSGSELILSACIIMMKLSRL